jgi:AcrR family transcriptional regulator
MNKQRREALSRDRIIAASIELLDSNGEEGLTFRALSEKLETGAGAIYWHIANKHDLLIAACDTVTAHSMQGCRGGPSPISTIRAVALRMFDAFDAHPWVGSALAQAPAALPTVRILEALGHEVRTLELSPELQWAAVGALLNYVLGVGGRHASNRQLARTSGTPRSEYLDSVATQWSKLDPQHFPFTQDIAAHVRGHDDRKDFIAGIDLILKGIVSTHAR